MYRVEVKNSCRCFLRSGYGEQQIFSTKEEAQEYAQELLEFMQKNFCKKHDFKLTSVAGSYTITIVAT